MSTLRTFFSHLLNRLDEGEFLLSAAVLSYTTLVALVPLTALGLGVLPSVPIFTKLVSKLQDFVFRNFVPGTGQIVLSYINEFTEHASHLSLLGTIFLAATVLLLILQIERILNRIWRVRESRRWVSRISVYGATLTVGPFLLGVSLTLTSYLVSLPFIRTAATAIGVGLLLLQLVPFTLAALAFTLAYWAIPNTKVPWKTAFTGGLIAAILFEITKYGFAFFITHFPTYQVLYGALAAIPIFLAWIYLSWLIILLGAFSAVTLQMFSTEKKFKKWGKHQEFILLCRLVEHIWNAQHQRKGCTFRELIEAEPEASHSQVVRLLEGLENSHIAVLENNHRWSLLGNAEEITLLDLYRSGIFPLPSPEELSKENVGWTETFRRRLINESLGVIKTLDRPIRDVYRNSRSEQAKQSENRAELLNGEKKS